MEERKLDGMFFRVCRDGKWQNLCLSDLTREEAYDVLKSQVVRGGLENGPFYANRVCSHIFQCYIEAVCKMEARDFEDDKEYGDFILDACITAAETLRSLGDKYGLTTVEEDEE